MAKRPALIVVGVAMGLGTPSEAIGMDSVARGAMVDVGVGTSRVGDTLMFELGGESAGIRSYGEGRWLLAWDVLVAGRAGWLVAQRPPLSFLGVHTLAWTELGVRLVASSRWSPYIGARIGGDVLLMAHPGLSLSALDTISNVDGVGGVVAHGETRVDAGVSFLDRSHASWIVGFAQEAFDAPGVYTPGYTFSEGGIGLRFDVARSVITEIDGFLGVSPARLDAVRGRTDQTTREGINASFRKIFTNGMWIGASAIVTRNTDSIVYSPGASFSTGAAPTIGLMLSYGVSLWKGKR